MAVSRPTETSPPSQSDHAAGRAGEAIPLCARIAAVADVYDALTSDRVYRSAMSHEEACYLVTRSAGTHFDPDVVEAFIAAEDEFLAVRQRHQSDSAAAPSPCLPQLALTDGAPQSHLITGPACP